METEKKYDVASGKVFVFGSNLRGIHGGGAARYAYDNLGAAEWGVGLGPMPTINPLCYAIPTKYDPSRSLPIHEIAEYVDEFLLYARNNEHIQFFVTRIGCGLAGFTDKEIAPLFKDAPSNCELPIGWRF